MNDETATKENASRAKAHPFSSPHLPPSLPNSRLAKRSFWLALANVGGFFFLHAIIEAFLLGGRATPGEPLGAGLKILYYVIPPIGMISCAIGAWMALSDLRLPDRSREFALMGLVINLVILVGLVILLGLTITMG